jgi:dipeptidase D
MFIRRTSFAMLRLLFSVVVLSAIACGDNATRPVVPPNTCDEGCVVDVFKDLSKVYRPSFGEEAARVWVQKQVDEAIALGIWEADEVTVEMDESVDAANHTIKNVLVHVPGTRPYEDRDPVALEGHLDMVFAVDGAAPGAPLDDYFRNGSDVVEEAGVLHSRDYKTTLGADCGTGVAQMVRYLFDRTLPHPPLELMFTAAEETGLVGALRWDAAKLPLRATAMINLDGWSATDVVKDDLHAPLAIQLGAAGGVLNSVDGKLDGSAIASNSVLVKISLTGLLGGHSGFLIGRPRMNAIVAFAALVREAIRLDPDVRVVSINSGQVSARLGHNKIPSAFEAVLAASSTTSVTALNTSLQAFFTTYMTPFSDEMHDAVKLEVTAATVTAPTAVTANATKLLVDILFELPNGVIEADPDSLGGWKVSSNIGVLGVNDAAAGKAVFFGYLPRSFVLEKSETLADDIFTEFQQTGIPNLTRAKASAPAWLVDRSAAIVVLAKAGAGINRDMVLPAGTEPGAFVEKFPQLKGRTIALAPAIIEAHTPREAVSIDSFREATTALQKILVALGDDASFLR